MTDAGRKNKEPDFKNKEVQKPNSLKAIFRSVWRLPATASKSPGQHHSPAGAGGTFLAHGSFGCSRARRRDFNRCPAKFV